MPNVLYIIEIAVALGLIIFVHELGHFLAAKRFGVRVPRFAIGFGPPILQWKRGGTEYSLRCLPLGGFVELTGEHPEADDADDPRAMWRRPAWQRAIIFSAGVGMNALLAIVFFTVASLIGVSAVSSLVGDVAPMFPAEKAGIKADDRIVAINGIAVESFEDVIAMVVSENAGTPFDVTVERRTGEGAATVRRTFEGIRSQRDPAGLAPRLGIEPALEPIIHSMIPGFPDHQAGLEVGDRIVAINGKPIHRWREIHMLLAEVPPGPVNIAVQRKGRGVDLLADPSKLKIFDLGMRPPVAIALVDVDGPAAEAGIRKGDRILRIEDVVRPGFKEFSDTVKAAGDGGTVRLVLARDGKTVEVTSRVAVYGKHEKPRIGVLMELAVAPPLQVGWVDPDGPAAGAGLRSGDVILKAGKDKVKPRRWRDLLAVFGRSPDDSVPLRIQRGDVELTTALTAKWVPVERFALVSALPDPLDRIYEPLPRLYNPLEAAERGFRRTWTWLKRVYGNLRQMAKREVGTQAVGGPVLIIQASMRIATHGIGTFIDFWGLLSVCLVVFNFLPVPPLDGGHVLFLVIEKIKGSPVGMKVRNAIWVAGWVAVLLLIAFITWQDIGRLMTRYL